MLQRIPFLILTKWVIIKETVMVFLALNIECYIHASSNDGFLVGCHGEFEFFNVFYLSPSIWIAYLNSSNLSFRYFISCRVSFTKLLHALDNWSVLYCLYLGILISKHEKVKFY